MARSNVVKAGQGVGSAGEFTIDLDHLDAQTMGDPGLRDEVLRLYASMSGVYLSRIEASADPADLAVHLHTLKSAAAGIGATIVRDRAGDAEAAIRAGQPVDAAQLLAIAAAVAECQDFIDTLVSAE
jgi:HPt (histidine-containing phosphotransfer) domain-containing protein